MKISIVTPSYNQDKYIEKTILSIWNQKGDFELEHIIIDGGSSDQSLAIINKYNNLYISGQFKYQCRNFTFSWLSETDSGQPEALNKGFSLSSGDILGWLNSDDVYSSNHSLQIIVKAFYEHDTDLVLGNTFFIDGYDNIIISPFNINNYNNDNFQKLLHHIMKINIIMQPSCFFKRHLWETFQIKNYYYIMDWVLWIDAFMSNCSFYKLTDYISSYRQHDNAKTFHAAVDQNDIINKCKEIISIYEKYGTWCYNRLYYTIYKYLLILSKQNLCGRIIRPIIFIGRKVRNIIALRYKLY